MVDWYSGVPIIRRESPGPRATALRTPCATRRPPGYVPYVVDNLWEWVRPGAFPNRRHAAFASPSADLIEVAGDPHRVELRGHCKVAQIPQRDARFHPDCKELPRLLLRLLGQEWVDSLARAKAVAGLLWAPCLSADEVDALFVTEPLAGLREQVRVFCPS